MNWIAALPMYNVTPALAADWCSLLADVLHEAAPQTRIVDPGDDLVTFWRRPDLLISQTCGYPLMRGLCERVQLIATPHFDTPGCVGANYSSVLVTCAGATGEAIEDFRGARAAYNQDDSNSGMNALRHSVAPFSRNGSFFAETIRTGSHLASLRAVADARADIAAIDCVTMAFVRDALPELAQTVREIGWTSTSPGLPLIAAREVPPAMIEALRTALEEARKADPVRAERLRLKGFSTLTLADYARIEQLQDEALAAGYARLV
ncbi:PhnD/SsuA/transferrin family substrate-binding protein [Paraburkholderia sp. BL10I2N1]|uniref:phosphate/phosphite/phosphonate ABC transporter substrate-binding protein n=1 Tax=Paraburkholderia sp. BL10I2N1 TaxID=1938796 RepID=UPI001061F162|nr:PhnD/SsuA/transferrin family substrate-binding protein [Paraburkholderia sp. BL10I2N1]